MMNYFGLTTEELEKKGAQWTAREIVQQPRIWQEVARLVESDTAGVSSFLAPLLRKPELRIVLTGAGTSAFIGECLAPALARHTHGSLKHNKRWVSAVSTTDIVAGPAQCLAPDVPTLLVSFARSGNSPESMAAVELAQQCLSECYHLIVTCNAKGALHQRGGALPNACVLLLPEEADDRGFAMTSSFSGMLLAAALVFGLPLFDESGPGTVTLDLLGSWAPRLRSLVAEGYERIVYLGANELKGLAHEAALKMLELTDGRVVALAQTPLGFRHGPKTILNRKTLVVALLANEAQARRYDLDLLAELRSDKIAGRVLALMAGKGGSSAHPDDILIPGLAGASDVGLCLPYALFAQSLALLQSLALGIRPDNPNAAGAVSRVVRGVTIYPW
ncbi:MAG TPA: tagatose-6-phosphate ketose isomerase [Steroidobacteraceae bacterium]